MASLTAAVVGFGVSRDDPLPVVSPMAVAVDAQRTGPTLASAAPGVTAAPASTGAAATTGPPPTAATSAIPRLTPTTEEEQRPLPRGAPGTWAVVLGVDDYQGASNLQAGVADADEVVATLLDAGVPGTNVLLLRNWEVTPASIVAASDWLVDRVGRDGLAVFAWAGHVRAVDADTEALVTGNGGLVTDATLATHLRRLRATRSWFLIAGCYGGGFTELLGPGRLLTAASPADQQAYENTLLGHSYVVEYVVRRGLHRREGPRVVSGAVTWAQQRIGRDHPGREPVGYTSGPVEPFVLGPNPTPTPADTTTASPM